MAQESAKTPRPRLGRRAIPAVAGAAVIALVTTLAVFAEGYDAKEIPPLETSVWVTRDAGQYARVNTDLAEIDTVRSVVDPVGVAQTGSDAVVFSSGYRQLWPIDAAHPLDLAEAGAQPSGTEPAATGSAEGEESASGPAALTGSQNTPAGTREVLSAGDYLVYLTDTGSVFLSSLASSDGAPPKAFPLDPFASVQVAEGEERPVYSATAIALSPEGRILMYSAQEKAVRTFDAGQGRFLGDAATVQNAPDANARVELAVSGDSWVLSSPGDSTVWLSGRSETVDTGLGGEARLQPWSKDGRTIHVADQNSLVSIDISSGAVTKVASGDGVPAAPREVEGVVFAAWLNTTGGSLWSSATKSSVALDVEGEQLDDVQVVVPRFYDNGARAVLAEQSTGLLWTVPDGKAIPVEQWSLGDDDHEAGTVQVDDLPQQEPPVAVADAFGVRAGRLVSLPLLLNDHDPNKKDVISIAPDSISGGLSDSGFGQLGLVGNDQTAVVQVSATSGSSTFTYAVTDGKAQSAPATVSLSVVPDDVNSAPEWCPVIGCVQTWPAPKIAAGGTAIVPVLDGWVDPEGDPIVLTDVRKVDQNAPVSVVPLAGGSVAIRHSDPNAGASVIMLSVVVSDSFGAVTEKELEVTVGATSGIRASPVAVTASPGQKVTVKIADHVTGGSGAYRVLDAVQSSAAGGGLIVVPNAAAGTVDVSATDPGEYTVSYSVQDAVTLSEHSSIIRLTVVAAGSPLTMAPLTAFVRANEDTTVDVIGAVQNTTGRVLLIASATASTPNLNVNVVAQSTLRVSGSTVDGQPGFIGTAKVTVNDGGGAVVTGEVSVFLVPSAFGVGPIAVPDSATVRAGAQVDVPVLRNDLSPRGERLVVHPDVQGSGAPGELAFATESTVRYLAPTVPGVYTVSYSVYLEGRPDRVDTAEIAVTVIAAGSNRDPEPPILNARANAGQTVLIPVDSYGMDPDGDRVTLVQVGLPATGKGVPSISSDGRAIVYAAPAGGVAGGQVSFEYTVRDPSGATGSGIVNVGVISSTLLDLTPVTYSDYVQVLRDSPTPVRVQPLLNDRDPAQGTLEILSLRPNAPGDSTNPEYARLEALIDPATSLKDGEIVLRSGDTLGTQSFVYTVQSSVSTSTAEGLIVVGVAESVAPDMPVVADTVLTAKDRSQLATGVDVVSGKVRWASGDVSSLTLSLWGSASNRYAVSGVRISGDLPPRGDLVPFELSGEDASGTAVTTHGFLRIPAFDDLRVQVKADAKRLEVNEEKAIDFDVRKLLDIEASDAIEIKSDGAFVVQRENASCEPLSGTLVRYTSGREAPWVDSCAFSVRIKGQQQWSTVAIPVWILPKDPQAILATIARTLAPGETATINLYDALTSWEGGRVGDKKLLDYRASFGGSAFVMEQNGSTITLTTRANAVPGTREAVQVNVSGFGGLVGGVSLVVGIAPPDAPRGATLNHQCTVSAGASCAITVVGVGGEYDPFAGKLGGGLKVVGVGTGTSMTCPVATVTVSGDAQVSATWPAGPRPVGGTCTVPLTVADAQGRTGPGKLTIDVLGYPQIPASVMTTSYTGTSVTVNVPLGEAAQAHPSVTSVVLYEGTGPVAGSACAPSGPASYSCTVPGLVNGAPHSYSARAVNSIGESLDTSLHQTWAYAKPVVTDLSAVSVFDVRTTGTTGGIDLSITAGPTTKSFRVVNVSQDFDRTGPVTLVPISLPPGSNTVVVIPISEFQPPIGGTGSNGQGDQVSRTVTAVGSPKYTSAGSATGTSASVTLSGASFNANGGVKASEIFVAWEGGAAEPACSATGGVISAPGAPFSSGTSTIPVATEKDYLVKACATNSYGWAESTPVPATSFPDPGAPGGDLTYRVIATPDDAVSSVQKYLLQKSPAPASLPNWSLEYNIAGALSGSFSLSDVTNYGAGLSVRYCRTTYFGDRVCSSSSATLSPEPDSAPTPVTVTFPVGPVTEVQANDPTMVMVSGSAMPFATVSSTLDPGALTVTYTVMFSGDYVSLPPTSFTTSYTPTPPPDPAPPAGP